MCTCLVAQHLWSPHSQHLPSPDHSGMCDAGSTPALYECTLSLSWRFELFISNRNPLILLFFLESARENLRCGDLSITVKTEANHDTSHSNVGIVIKVVRQVTDRAQDSVPGSGGKVQRSEAFDRGRGVYVH